MINNILISRETRKVLSKDNRFIGIEGENLQEVLVFNLDKKIEGSAIIEIQFRDETTGYIEVEKTDRGYELPVKSSLLTQEGIIKMQLKIVQAGQEVFKSEIIRFDVDKAINATETIPEQYPTWINNLEALKLELQKEEEGRVEAEKSRASAEKERVETFNQMGQAVDNAIGSIADLQEEYDANAIQKTTEFNRNVDNQTEAFDEHVKNKTTEFDEHTEEITNRIIDIEEKDINQDKLIENLQNQVIELETENETLKNQIPTGQAEGENITITDSSDMEFKELRIGGNSWQETRSGKNKLKNTATTTTVNGITFTVNNNGTVIANGTATAVAQIQVGKPIVGTYKYTGCPSGGAFSNSYRMRIRNSASPYTEYGTDIGNGTELTFENVLDSDVISLTIDNGVTVNNLVFKPMISVEGGDYEQYGAMPSPEFRSEIRNVTGSANITVCNKNFFDINQVNNLAIGSSYGKPSVVMEDSTFRGYTLNLDKNQTKITISRKNITDFNRFRFGFTDMLPITEVTVYNDNWVEGFIEATTLTSITFSIPIQAKYLFCYFSNVNEEITEEAEIQIEYGEKTEYQPHQSQQFTFPLKPGQRMYKDSYLADDGVHHKRGVFALYSAAKLSDGTGDLEPFKYAVYALPDQRNESQWHVDFLSDRIKGRMPSVNSSVYSGYQVGQSFVVLTYKEDTLDNFNAKIKGATVEYSLENEVVEPYTEEQQLVYNKIKKAHSYKNVTHIFSTDEIKPVLDVTYRKDLDAIGGDDYVITETDKKEIAETVEPLVRKNIQPTLNEIKAISQQAETIARGRATGYVFDTLQDLEIWLQNNQNISKLVLGDNFYIRALDVPDYWWDGSQKQQLEAEKPVLTGFVKEEELEDYATKEYVDILIGDIEKELGGI